MRHMQVTGRLVWRYALALTIIIAAFLARQALGDFFGAGMPFITFYPAAMLCGLLTGLGPSLVGIALAAFLMAGWELAPDGKPFELDSPRIVSLVVFVVVTTAMNVVFELYHRSRRKTIELEKAIAKENEDRFRALFDVGVNGVCVSQDGQIVEANETLARMLGYERRELVGKMLREVVCSEDIDGVLERISREGEMVIEHVMVRKDGARIEVEAHGRTVELRGRKMRVTSLRDITERNRAQEALRCSEEKFAQAFAQNPAALIITRLEDGLIVEVNDTWVAMMGYTREEIRGISARALLIWPDPDANARFVKELKEKGSLFGWEQEFRRKSGEMIVAQLSAHVLTIGGQTVILSTLLDITERKRTEEALREALERAEEGEALLRALMDYVPEGITIADMSGEVRMVSRHGQKLLGGPHSGKSIEEVASGWKVYRADGVTPISSEELPLNRAIRSGEEVHDFELVQANALGRKLPLLCNAAPIRNPSGEIVGGVVSWNDISERKRAERLLKSQAEHLESLVQERTAKLQAAIEELEHFSYCITHDMRAPLRAMRSYGELLMTDNCVGCTTPLGKEFLKRIMSAAQRMDALIVDALDYSKVSRGDVKLEAVDVGSLVRGVIESYPNLHADGVEIVLDGEFPQVLGHGAGLTQCFSNLLGNAVKFVAPGNKPKLRVWAEPKDPGPQDSKWVRIWISDNGIGIPKGCEDRIFEMFQRLGNANEGTGIGLAIVKKTIERMGGRVGVESEPGQGSRFWMELQGA